MCKDEKRETNIFPVFLMGGLFVLTHSLALLITRPFETTGTVAFNDPNDPMNIFFFFSVLLVFTVAILLIAKYWKKQVIRGIFLGAIGFTAFNMFYPLFIFLVPELWSLCFSVITACILIIALVKYPEWYVIDVCGTIVSVGSIGIFGVSLNVSLVIVLLLGLAVYDAVAVYKTKHMIDLADTVVGLRLPVMLIIPKIREYSLLKETKGLKERLEEGEERDAFVMGLGDVTIPGILVASTFHNIANNGLLIALSVMIGTLFGFVLLMRIVIKGKPQAGLPYLCGGAILGYLISSYLLFGDLVGLSFPI